MQTNLMQGFLVVDTFYGQLDSPFLPRLMILARGDLHSVCMEGEPLAGPTGFFALHDHLAAKLHSFFVDMPRQII
jgi:hypothetical protein